MGSVTARSISSGAIPGSCVTICTCTSCTSGNASIGSLSTAPRPKAPIGEHGDARIHFRLQPGVEVLDRAAHLHATGRRVNGRGDALDAPAEALPGPSIGFGGHRLADRDFVEMLLRQIHH